MRIHTNGFNYSNGSCSLVKFLGFELHRDRRELRYGGQLVKLRKRPLDVLFYLMDARERVVPREELLEVVWADTCVSDAAVASAIRDLRKALSGCRAGGGAATDIVQTHHGFGYRFVAEISVDPSEASSQRLAPVDPNGAPSRAWLEGFLQRLSAFLAEELRCEPRDMVPEVNAWLERETAALGDLAPH